MVSAGHSGVLARIVRMTHTGAKGRRLGGIGAVDELDDRCGKRVTPGEILGNAVRGAVTAADDALDETLVVETCPELDATGSPPRTAEHEPRPGLGGDAVPSDRHVAERLVLPRADGRLRPPVKRAPLESGEEMA